MDLLLSRLGTVLYCTVGRRTRVANAQRATEAYAPSCSVFSGQKHGVQLCKIVTSKIYLKDQAMDERDTRKVLLGRRGEYMRGGVWLRAAGGGWGPNAQSARDPGPSWPAQWRTLGAELTASDPSVTRTRAPFNPNRPRLVMDRPASNSSLPPLPGGSPSLGHSRGSQEGSASPAINSQSEHSLLRSAHSGAVSVGYPLWTLTYRFLIF